MLKRRDADVARRTLLMLLGFLGLAPAILIGYVFVVCYPADGAVDDPSAWVAAVSAFWRQLSAELTVLEVLEIVGAFLGSIAVAYVGAALLPRQRLVVSADTLRWYAPLPRWLRFATPGWTLNLGEIVHARLGAAVFGTEANATLVLKARAGSRELKPTLWVEESTPAPPLSFTGSVKSISARPRRDELLKSPLCAALIDAGVTIEGLEEDGRSPGKGLSFRLEANGATRVVMVLVIGFLCYAIVDTMLFPEQYVTAPPLRWLFAGGVFSAAFGFVYLHNNDVPIGVNLALCALLGPVTGGACWPGLLRINAAVDADGLQTVTYHRTEGNRFEADGGWPPVSLPEPAYWILQDEGIEREIHIRRGGLGLYQVNLENIRAELRDYFRSR